MLACSSQHLLSSDISLEPMYGNKPKTTTQLHADQQLVEKARESFGGDMRAAAKDAIRHGTNAMHAGDYDKAIRRFNQAWLFDPSIPQVYEGFAAYLVAKGRVTEASEYIERAHQLDPNDPRIKANLTRMRQVVGR